LSGQADALGLASTQRRGGAVELQVAQSDPAEEFESLGDFRQDVSCDFRFPALQSDFIKFPGEIIHGQVVPFRYGVSGEAHGEGNRIEAVSLTIGTGHDFIGFLAGGLEGGLALRAGQAGIDGNFGRRAVAMAGRAPAVGAVKRKEAGIEGIEGTSRLRAEEFRAVDGFPAVVVDRVEGAVSDIQCLIDQHFELIVFPVDGSKNRINGMLPVSVEGLKLSRCDPFFRTAHRPSSV